MKFLFIAAQHHPAELAKARAAAPPGTEPPLFPPSMSQHFWDLNLRAMGHETAVFDRLAGVLPLMGQLGHTRIVQGVSQLIPQANPDYRLRNKRLLQVARDLRPDVLLLSGGNEQIYPATLAQIKAETGATLVYLMGVSPVVFSHANERAAAPLYDLALVNDFYHGVQLQELGAPRVITQPYVAIEPDFHRPVDLTADEQAAYGCEVGFVGTLTPPHLYGRRVQMLAALADYDLGIWSIHAVPDELRRFHRGAALGADMLRILSGAQIALNVHGDFMLYGGNMRLFELAAIGAFQIADDLPGVREWFTPGENIVTFTDEADLREKVAHYLAHPAERVEIAAAARAHVVEHHTYRQRMQQLVGLVEEMRG